MSDTSSRTDADGDEVDRIVLAWARARPDVDLSPMQVFSRVSRLARRAARHTDVVLQALDLKRSEASVIFALVSVGPPYERSAGDLARDCFVTTGTLTKRIDRLLRRDFVTRRQVGVDGRVVTIRLTAAGKRKAEQAMTASLVANASTLTGLTKSEHRQLASLLRKININTDQL